MSGPLEQVYDEQIAPLMQEIIAVCKANNLPVLASFRLDGDLLCTTHIAPPRDAVAEGDRETHELWLRATSHAVLELRNEPVVFAMTVTTGPGGRS